MPSYSTIFSFYQVFLSFIAKVLMPHCMFWALATSCTETMFLKQPPQLANLISKLNFYKLIPYPMDNMLNRSVQTGQLNVRKRRPVFPPAGRSSHCALDRWRIVLPCCLDNLTSWHLFRCLNLLDP